MIKSVLVKIIHVILFNLHKAQENFLMISKYSLDLMIMKYCHYNMSTWTAIVLFVKLWCAGAGVGPVTGCGT